MCSWVCQRATAMGLVKINIHKSMMSNAFDTEFDLLEAKCVCNVVHTHLLASFIKASEANDVCNNTCSELCVVLVTAVRPGGKCRFLP